MNYQVIEDNAGGLYLFFFENENVVLGIENLEYTQPGDLTKVGYEDAKTWDSQLDDPQETYIGVTVYEFGWEVVADQDGVYPEKMGRAAQIIYQIGG